MRSLGLALALMTLLAGAGAGAEESTLTYGPFGTVTVYRGSGPPSSLVLFVSGEGGWNLGVVDMARALVGLDAVVVGIDVTHFLKQLEADGGRCAYPAGDLQMLAQFVEQRLGYPDYVLPVLVGYSSGAPLVYAAIVQAPPSTFRGALSLGFCPDLPLSRPPCRGAGLSWGPGPKGKGVSLLPSRTLGTTWVAFQGLIDQVCNPAETERFVGETRGARLVTLPKVGHGFAVQRNWMPQFRTAFRELAGPSAPAPVRQRSASAPVAAGELPATPPLGAGTEARSTAATPPAAGAAAATEPPSNAAVSHLVVPDVSDLPLVEVRAVGEGGDTLAVIVSGDGGWSGLDRDLAAAFAADGIPTVGLDSLRYFWKARTPAGSAADLERIVSHYTTVWGKTRLLLVGYSFGADVLPFMVDGLTDRQRSEVAVVALLAPSPEATFEFHFSEWFGGSGAKGGLPVAPQVEKLGWTRVLCMYGEDDAHDSVCPALPEGAATVVRFGGGHHFGGDYRALATTILKAAR